MSTISDYLEWRGDLPFSSAPFNEVDNYIIAKIGCPDYTGIVSGGNDGILLPEAVRAFFSRDGITDKSLGVLASESILRTLRLLPDTARFSGLLLSGYRKIVDQETSVQFSALTLTLPDGTHYVSFRGTDDTITGWKENFMMAVMNSVPAQDLALSYLTWAAENYKGKLIVGGHSKGGNLAFYAAAKADPAIQDRIIAVYNNDGPGFNEEFLSNAGFDRIGDRMHYIVPQTSLIGTLLLQPCDFQVVKCPVSGVGSHDGYRWEVKRDHFERADGLSLTSRAFNDAIETTLSGMTKPETEEFIDQLFDILYAGGQDSLTGLTEQKLSGLLSTVRTLHKDSRIHGFFHEVLENTISEIKAGILPDARRKLSRKSKALHDPA